MVLAVGQDVHSTVRFNQSMSTKYTLNHITLRTIIHTLPYLVLLLAASALHRLPHIDEAPENINVIEKVDTTKTSAVSEPFELEQSVLQFWKAGEQTQLFIYNTFALKRTVRL